MNIKEFFFGTQRELEARARLKLADNRKSLPHVRRDHHQEEDRGISRRYFLRVGGVACAGGLLTAATGLLWFPAIRGSETETYSDPKLQGLARDIRAWSLIDGRRMASIFPEVEKAAVVLAGERNTRLWLPHVNSRLRFADNSEGDASLDTWREEDQLTKRRVQVAVQANNQYPNGINIDYRWFDREASYKTITLSPEIQASSLKLPVAVKETSQAYDYLEYSRLYIRIAEQQGGATFKVINPDGIPIDEGEKTANIAEVLGFAERQLTKEPRSFLDYIIDSGSHIRVGGIMFANWYQDQLYRGITLPRTTIIQKGLDWVSFLEQREVIKRDGNFYTWAQGSAPRIDSAKFIDLIRELTGKAGPRFN